MAKLADLHIHTHFSDSTSSPREVLEQAQQKGIHCIAITDHDSVEGVAPTIELAKEFDIEVIPGIELSTQINNKDIHMLGYFFDFTHPTLTRKLTEIQSYRQERMQLMIEKLHELGIGPISFDEVCALTEGDAVGRPHLATILVKMGVVSNIKQAFNKYLADDQPAFVSKNKLTPFEGIKMIREFGGVPVLAHPMFTLVDELIPQFAEAGMGGIETYYPNCSPKTMEFYGKLARKYNLATTGGSDAHGDAKKNTYLGKMTIPYELVEQLKEKANA